MKCQPRRLVVAAAVWTFAGLGLPPAASAAADQFTVIGAGWGHGVGMSQYGALGQAREGRTATEILEHYYEPARVTTVTGDPTVRVQILGAAGTATVTSDSGQLRIRADGDTVTVDDPVTFSAASIDDRPAVRVRSGALDQAYPGEIRVQWPGTSHWPGQASPIVTLESDGSAQPARYRHGQLRIAAVDDALTAVVEVALHDEYLYGVDEVPSSWPSDALQAQVVAARTYALRRQQTGVNEACRCHLYGDSRGQRYTGWGKESDPTYGDRWVAAVDATVDDAGAAIVTMDGRPIDAVYSSSTGGRTQNSEDVWGGELPYLRSRPDPWSLDPDVNPHASWEVTVSRSQVATAFGLPDVAAIDVVSRTAAGAAETVRATSAAGQDATLTGEQVRLRLGLRSAWVQSIG